MGISGCIFCEVSIGKEATYAVELGYQLVLGSEVGQKADDSIEETPIHARATILRIGLIVSKNPP
jgi:hypothetical protein